MPNRNIIDLPVLIIPLQVDILLRYNYRNSPYNERLNNTLFVECCRVMMLLVLVLK